MFNVQNILTFLAVAIATGYALWQMIDSFLPPGKRRKKKACSGCSLCEMQNTNNTTRKKFQGLRQDVL